MTAWTREEGYAHLMFGSNSVCADLFNGFVILNRCFQNLTRLYLDKATLVWNGNAVTGHDALGEFFESLPSSEFQVQSLDCQPVHGMHHI